MTHATGAAIDGYTRHMAAGNSAPATIRLRQYWLERLAAEVAPLDATAADLEQFLSRPGWKPETRKSIRSTLTGFYAWTHQRGLTPTDPAAALPRVHVPRGRPRPTPDAVIRDALGRADPRTGLMVQLANLQGLRRSEIARLHTDHVEGDALRVRGKGGTVRLLPLHPVIAEQLAAVPAGYVFPSPHGGHLSPDAVGRILSRHLGPGWSGHTLRHAAASRWYRNTRDIVAVRDLLGHASVATTQIYTATPDDALRAAIFATGGTAA